MKTNEQRINTIIGQLKGVERMMQSKDSECLDVIVQLKAVRSAVSSLMDKLAGEEFSSCLCQSNNQGKIKMQKIVSELIKNK